jgi:hypothetical protein
MNCQASRPRAESARRGEPGAKPKPVLLDASRKDPYKDDAPIAEFADLGNAGLGVFVPDDDHVTHADLYVRPEVAEVPARQPLVVCALEVDPEVPSHASNTTTDLPIRSTDQSPTPSGHAARLRGGPVVWMVPSGRVRVSSRLGPRASFQPAS